MEYSTGCAVKLYCLKYIFDAKFFFGYFIIFSVEYRVLVGFGHCIYLDWILYVYNSFHNQILFLNPTTQLNGLAPNRTYVFNPSGLVTDFLSKSDFSLTLAIYYSAGCRIGFAEGYQLYLSNLHS